MHIQQPTEPIQYHALSTLAAVTVVQHVVKSYQRCAFPDWRTDMHSRKHKSQRRHAKSHATHWLSDVACRAGKQNIKPATC